jgi:hypothetical protein
MKNAFLSYIRPALLKIDQGAFFKTPFVWIYVGMAVVSVLGAFTLILDAFALNDAYLVREHQRSVFESSSLTEFKKINSTYERLNQETLRYEKEMNDASDSLSQATAMVDYCRDYSNYGVDTKMDFAKATETRKAAEATLQAATVRWENASKALEQMKPQYEKALSIYQKASAVYDQACTKYERANRTRDAFHGDVPVWQALLALILYVLSVLILGWLNFQIWWCRRTQIRETSGKFDECTATPVFAHFLQTFGESMGLTIAVLGFITALIMSFLDVSFGQFGWNLIHKGVLGFVLPPVVGYLVLFAFRVVAELTRSLVVIANNSKI